MNKLQGEQFKLEIPCTTRDDILLGSLYSNMTQMADIWWSAQFRQVYLKSSLSTTLYATMKFDGYSNNSYFKEVLPKSGDMFGVSPNGILTFSSAGNSFSPVYNIYKNGDIIIVDNCSICDYNYNDVVVFDMSVQYLGDQQTGKNIVLIASDSFSISSKEKPIPKKRGRPRKSAVENE